MPTTEELGHVTRYSDSSLYDEVCTPCGATDAQGSDRLQQPYPAAKKKRNVELFDLEASMAITQRCDHVVRVAVATYRLRLHAVLGREPMRVFPLYYPGMPAYDAARLQEEAQCAAVPK